MAGVGAYALGLFSVSFSEFFSNLESQVTIWVLLVMLALKNTHVFTSGEYLKLFESNILDKNSRTELIDGEIIQLAPLGFKHAKTQKQLAAFIAQALNSDDVYTTGSTTADANSMPEPDIFVLKPGVQVENNYPHLSQISMVVEVADSTLNTDLINDGTGKLAKYAQCHVELVWVVDVEKKAIHQFTDPRNGYYTTMKRLDKSIELNTSVGDLDELIA